MFDLLVVTASLLPDVGAIATLAHVSRLLRVARLVTVLLELRLIVGTMLRSVASLGHIAILLGLLNNLEAAKAAELQSGGSASNAEWRNSRASRACLIARHLRLIGHRRMARIGRTRRGEPDVATSARQIVLA